MAFLGQDPTVAPAATDTGGLGADFLTQLQEIGWVDRTALAVLLVFFVIGLFKGLIWQVSRIAILLAAYFVSGRYGRVLGDWLASPAGGSEPGSVSPAVHSTADGVNAVEGALHVEPTSETTLYLAYVLLFLGVLIVLSLAAILLQKLANKAGLGFFDRLGGGMLGVATGGCLVLFGLSVVHMFFRGSQLAMAAEHSHSLRLSQRAIAYLGSTVPDDLRRVFALQPLDAQSPGQGMAPTDPTDGVVPPPTPGTDPQPDRSR